jgi:hypothetical protein
MEVESLREIAARADGLRGVGIVLDRGRHHPEPGRVGDGNDIGDELRAPPSRRKPLDEPRVEL